VVWQENHKFPNIIVEFLSPSTAKVDKTTKKTLYQDTFSTPEYFWFNLYNSLEFGGFRLQNGKYQPIEPNAQGYLWSQELGLYLGLHEGFIRYFTLEGELVLSPQEDSAQSRQQAAMEAVMREYAEQRATQAEQRAMTESMKMSALLAKLRELNIDIDSL
jgi:hypothetical protein